MLSMQSLRLQVWDLVPSDVNKMAHWMMLSVGKDSLDAESVRS